MLKGITRLTLAITLLACLWLLPETYGKTVMFWGLVAINVGLAGVIVVPVRFEWRARLFVGLLWLFTVSFVQVTGMSGGMAMLVAMATVSAVLLLGVKQAAGVLGATFLGLAGWVVRLAGGWVARPSPALTDAGNALIAARQVFIVSLLGIGLLAATSFLFRQLTVTLDEAERLVVDLRAQMAARDVEARRRGEAERKLFESQKMEAIGELAGGVAHDVNNSLTVALASAELILDERTSESDQAELAMAIRDACSSASALTRQLLAIGRKDVFDPVVVAPGIALEGVERMVRSTVTKRAISLSVSAPAESPGIRVDVAQLRQVLLNLSINARDAMPRGGELHFEVDCAPEPPPYALVSSDIAPERPVRVHVRDTGEGITDAALPHIFEPFFTTKDAGNGSGLGLSLARAFAEASGGRVGVRSRVGEGTTVTIELPGVAMAASRAEPAQLTAGGKRILVVDDDPRVRGVIEAVLRDAGHDVIAAESGEAALAIVADGAAPIDLLCTDARMPGAGGEGLARRFRELRPTTPILVCSGYVQDAGLRAWIEAGRFPVVHKPFTPAELRERVRATLERPGSGVAPAGGA